MNNQFTHPKERIRFAILTFFFAQGLCMASWASRIPDFKDVFAANYAFYWGLILFMIPVGKFVAIPLAGYLVSKFRKPEHGTGQYSGIRFIPALHRAGS